MRYDFARNNGTAKKRMICFIMGLILLVASMVPAGLNIFATETDDGYSHKSFEVHPDEEDPDKTVALEGMMPKNASVEVVDVTADFIDEDDSSDDGDAATGLVDGADAATGLVDGTDVDEDIATSGDADAAADSYADGDIEYTENTAALGDAQIDSDEEDKSEIVGEEEENNKSAIVGEEDQEDKYTTIAAYDITIKVGKTEYQPTEKRPVKVEITDDRIRTDRAIKVYHIKDDGELEEITDIIVSDGSVSFDATGFSIYEIVDLYATSNADSLDDIVDGQGFYIYNDRVTDKGMARYLTSTLSSNKITTTGDIDSAAVYYFEKIEGTENKFHIFFYDNNHEKVYLYTKSLNSSGIYSSSYVDEESVYYAFAVKKSDYGDAFYISVTPAVLTSDKQNYWYFDGTDVKTNRQFSNGDYNVGKNRYEEQTEDFEKNILFSLTLVPNNDVELDLDGLTCGLMNYTGGVYGYALMAGDSVDALIEVVTHETATQYGKTVYVDEDSEVTRWTFNKTGDGNYKLSADTDNGTKYLAVSEDSLVLVDNLDDATAFKVNIGENSRIQLEYDSKYVNFAIDDDGQVANSYFYMSDDNSSNNSYLRLIDYAQLSDSDLIMYSAERVSVSEVPDGAKVIVYTRIWNSDDTRYDIYAVDQNGALFKCYASGDKIYWLGDGTSYPEWTFTEYRDAVTKEINYYYELYNAHSQKYIAPQLSTAQALSDDPIGINMPGRRNGDFYSDLIAWDEDYYSYIGLMPNEDNTMLVPCIQSKSLPFYFATIEPLNLSGDLHKVDTINNYDYGITIKMSDFNGASFMNKCLPRPDNDGAGKPPTQGLLSTNLGDDGYPTFLQDYSSEESYKGESLAILFNNETTTEVNGLFIDSIYESSGYFEFDSCQNFATLRKDDGKTLKEATTYTDTKGEEHSAIEFTVYRELGTTTGNSCTRKHGQFFPYDNIVGKPLSTVHKNTYSALTNEQGTMGELSEDDPRKYESLYNISSPNYQLGMELEASFIQTVSGLDAWGHDIIFEFTGDDDFWLYVDGELVIDLGGVHSALEGNVNFRTGVVYVNGETTTLKQIFIDNYTERYKLEHGADAVPPDSEIQEYLLQYFQPKDGETYGCEDIFADYSLHTMRIFYTERGAGASNLYMRFNLASVKPGRVVVSKTVTGGDSALLDTDFVEYPFQIYYTIPNPDYPKPEDPDYPVDPDDPDAPPETIELLLGNDEDFIGVSYQDSTDPVNFVEMYRPPGVSEAQAFHNVYFLNPTKNAEISFPDETISYRIVECAVDSTVYGNVLINGKEADKVDTIGEYKCYSSSSVTAEERPVISFENVMNDNVIKDLFITKRLVDEDDHEITNDDATFSFRLYLSSVDVEDIDDLKRVNMYNYYVVKIEGDKRYICKRDRENGGFNKTDIEYSRENIAAIKDGDFDGIDYDNDICFTTSGFGAISGIPSGYTICVPGLPIGTVFMVTEDIKSGYGLDRYEMVEGEIITTGGESSTIASYDNDYLNSEDNVGKVVKEVNPLLDVINKKGYGLTVKKEWSDLDATVSHDPVYVAVYADDQLIDDSVRAIVSPETSVYYFWTSLKDARTTFEGYVVREVTLTGDITIAKDGKVSGYTAVTPLESGESLKVNATRTSDATPVDETTAVKEYTYEVSYEEGENSGTTRTDTITNTRKECIALRLFKWDSEVPLQDGVFTLNDSNGDVIGEFTSDGDGLIKLLYGFERDEIYTLTETAAPDHYIGLQKTLKFKISEDDSVILLYDDGTTSWGNTDEDDLNWAKWKKGEDEVAAFVDIYNKMVDGNYLTITKTVTGNHGNKDQEFTFTFAIAEDDGTTEYEFIKNNGDASVIKSGGNFTMKHGDTAVICIPAGKTVTVSENSLDYQATVKLGNGDMEERSSKTFEFTDDTTIEFTNTREAVIPTGIESHIPTLLVVGMLLIGAMFLFLRGRHRRYNEE